MKAFLILFLAASFSTLGMAETEASSQIDALLAKFDDNTPGLVIGHVENGELVFSRAAGMADLRFGIHFEVDTPTNVGSTAKQFTGFALALLHEQGKLSLDDDIRDYFPNLPDFGETVRLRHLVTHTSGYREFLNALALSGRDLVRSDWINADEAISLVERQPVLQNSPGAEWNYNNTGYVLLARVIEQVTDTPFVDWMAQEVFNPLGMESTRVRPAPDRLVPGASTGYRKEGDDYVEARDVGGAPGAGGVYTTLGDMALWMQHLGRFELGGQAVREHMVTAFELSDGESANYGMGLFIDEWRGLTRWQHGGGDMGHLSAFYYFPDLDAGYMVFANHHDFEPGFMSEVGEVFFADHLEAAGEDESDGTTEVQLVEADEPFVDELFDRYAGQYELVVMPGFILRFFREDDRYMIQATGQPAFEIKPVAASEFTIEVVQARIQFHVDEDGSVDELTLFQNGEHRAVRIEDESEAAVALDDFVGRYFSEELETFYEISVEDGSLELSHRRFGPLTLHHAGDDRFSGGFPVSQVEFIRDDEGNVTALDAGNVRARDIRFERLD